MAKTTSDSILGVSGRKKPKNSGKNRKTKHFFRRNLLDLSEIFRGCREWQKLRVIQIWGYPEGKNGKIPGKNEKQSISSVETC